MASPRPSVRRSNADNSATRGPTIQDVAQHAGLNNPGIVSEQTRLKVEAAIAELGFIMNSAARSPAARRTDTVGLILTDIGNSLFVDIARGAESAAQEAGSAA